MEYFWKKKIVVSFVLSIFVFWIHITSFGQYLRTSVQGLDSDLGTLVGYLSVFFTNTFVRLAVPLFFILSGAAYFRNYDNKKFLDKLKVRVWSLIIPYLIWNTFGLIFEIVTSYTFVSQYFLLREKFVISFQSVIKAILFHECNGPFWFISSLIVFVFLSPFFDLLLKTKTTAILAVIVFIVISQFEIPVFSTLINGIDSLVYYMVGCVIGRYGMKQFSVGCKKSISICALCVFVLCTIVWFIRGIGIFELPVPLNTSFLIIYALSFWFASDIIDISNIQIKPFMDSNLFLYAMHLNLSAVIVKLIYIILPKHVLCSIPNFILTSVLTILIILLFAAFLRKYLNGVYLVLSGKKKRSTVKK